MKKIISIFLLFICATVILSCKKESADVSTLVDVSFPSITLKGDSLVGLELGSGTYADAGATSYDSIQKTSTELIPISNNVDLSKPGFYSVQYQAKNIYGFRTNKKRLVLVSAVSASDDISGVYKRTTNQQSVTLTKKGSGLYVIDNIGGVGGDESYLFPVYIGVPTEMTVDVPPQTNPFGGDVYVTDGKLTRTASTITFSYVVIGAGFGTATRTFVKVL